MKNCDGCALKRKEWPGSGTTSKTGFCIWFLKKLQVPRAIPAATAVKGCSNWKAK